MTIFSAGQDYNPGMDVIYIDSLFLLNLIIDYLLLLGAARLCGLPLRRKRFGLAAALGALWSVGIVLPGGAFLALPSMKLVLSAVMALIAYGRESHFFRSWGAFLLVSAALGGAVWAASMLGGVPRGASAYVPVSLRVLLLSFGLCYVALRLLFARSIRKREREVISVSLEFAGRSVSFQALRDTGNELYDPAGGRRVCVAEARVLCPLFPPEYAAVLHERDPIRILGELSRFPACRGRLSLVPYSSVGVERGLLPALRPDRLTVNGQTLDDTLIAVSPTILCSDGEYSAVL